VDSFFLDLCRPPWSFWIRIETSDSRIVGRRLLCWDPRSLGWSMASRNRRSSGFSETLCILFRALVSPSGNSLGFSWSSSTFSSLPGWGDHSKEDLDLDYLGAYWTLLYAGEFLLGFLTIRFGSKIVWCRSRRPGDRCSSSINGISTDHFLLKINTGKKSIKRNNFTTGMRCRIFSANLPLIRSLFQLPCQSNSIVIPQKIENKQRIFNVFYWAVKHTSTEGR
jgi:hypothetical protein